MSRSRNRASPSDRALLQVFDVPVYRVDLVDGHAPLDAAADGTWFVLGKVVAGLAAQQDEYFIHRAWVFGAATAPVWGLQKA